MPDEIELYDDLPYWNLAMEVVGTKSELKVWTDEGGSGVDGWDILLSMVDFPDSA